MHYKTTALLLPILLSSAGLLRAQPMKIDISDPPGKAELFCEGLISTGLNERDMAISPDGNELFYTIVSPLNMFSAIVQMKKDGKGNWSGPEVASFSGTYNDLEPAFSPDGKKLFFVSNRPVHDDSVKDFDIWYLSKTNGAWTNPVNLGSPVNTEANEFYPAVAANGNLYFTAAYNKGKGKEDIYVARWENGRYADPVSLDSAVNSPMYEFNAYVSPDEQFIIFSSYGRTDDHGRGDLYISVKDAAGNWQPAKNLAILNSPRLDYCPFVSFDKKTLFFTSERTDLKESYPDKKQNYSGLMHLAGSTLNGSGNIYRVRFDQVMKSVE